MDQINMRLAQTAFLVLVVVYVAPSAAQFVPQAIKLQMTIRDFNPGPCMRAQEFRIAWDMGQKIWDGINPELYSALEGSALRDEFNGDMKMGNQNFPMNVQWYTQQERDTILAKFYCRGFFEYMVTNQISGHPDFEAQYNVYINSGHFQTFELGGNLLHDIHNSIIKPTLVQTDSGVDTVEYCDNDPNQRCGLYGNTQGMYSQSRKEYFDTWYNDHAKYNKRVGHVLTLENSQANPEVFTYEKATADDRFHPLDGLQEVSKPYNPWKDRVWYNSLEPKPTDITPTKPNKFWFTTELHTFFTYNGNEVFTMVGDDDMWVFVDKKLAIDLGGLHPILSQTVFLNDTRLGLVPGQHYQLDIFHAERHHSVSNYKIETTLLSSCNVHSAGILVYNLETDVTSSNLQLSETLHEPAKEIQMYHQVSPPSGSLPLTFAMVSETHIMSLGFTSTFNFVLGPNNKGMPFAFLITSKDNSDFALGSSDNFGSIISADKGFAVVFEPCEAFDPAAQNCEEQQVAIYSNGVKKVHSKVMRAWRYDNERHYVRVEYLGTPSVIEVYLDNSLYLRSFIGNENLQQLELSTDYQRVGFVAKKNPDTAPSAAAPLTIREFLLRVLKADISRSRLVYDPATCQDDPSFKYVYETTDGCGKKMPNGGSFLTAFLVPQPPKASQPPQAMDVVDNGDGTYSLSLPKDYPSSASFSIFVTGSSEKRCTVSPASYDAISSQWLWNNDCSWTHVIPNAYCVTTSPTRSPTKSPSKQPTRSPIPGTSVSPTASPTTPAPTTLYPTKAPTNIPTASPNQPSKSPSHDWPSPSPTKSPIHSWPTPRPTTWLQPHEPSKVPTPAPSMIPTLNTIHSTQNTGAQGVADESNESGGSNTGVIIGAAVGAVAFVALAVGFVIIRKKRNAQPNAFASPPPGTMISGQV
mmetsp:Transcript_1863/g.3673  ORF Transcript_1863/g.3673 Transcript_1863/m.3673 type:complete len:918 (-) Transcript_1863:224-2977(-)